MTQTLLVVVLFVGAMAMLPWLVRRLQQRQGAAGTAAAGASRVLSAVAVGPHQRVVTVEVGPEHARTLLVLGVTAQNVSCLHTMPVSSAQGSGSPVSAGDLPHQPSSFAQEIAAAVGGPGKTPHG
ncbi:FliO/MopB family protein [Paracidovorax sp. MALMAid1276]|uniref:FliO/MopB family protein n=1 Tax=Paracidovorax sp. MALMAid1276 TaxID=3411631 RepID=UPI003B9CB829